MSVKTTQFWSESWDEDMPTVEKIFRKTQVEEIDLPGELIDPDSIEEAGMVVEITPVESDDMPDTEEAVAWLGYTVADITTMAKLIAKYTGDEYERRARWLRDVINFRIACELPIPQAIVNIIKLR